MSNKSSSTSGAQSVDETHRSIKLIAEVANLAVEFGGETILSLNGKPLVHIPSNHWQEVVATSEKYDFLRGESARPPLRRMSEDSASAAVSAPCQFPEIGAPIGGGFCAGGHPFIAGAVLVVAGIDGEARDLTWERANEHCRDYRGGGFDDWRNFDRIEGITLFDRLGPNTTEVKNFADGGAEALADAGYWTGQQHQFNSGCAWGQYFGGGHSYDWLKGSEARVRPVRILFI